MSDGGQVQRRDAGEDAPEEQADATSRSDAREVIDDVDELLDEIDDVLEENAEEFVRSYVQKGGQ
jgi:prokaryotic ubiquitin-like protein Pup